MSPAQLSDSQFHVIDADGESDIEVEADGVTEGVLVSVVAMLGG